MVTFQFIDLASSPELDECNRLKVRTHAMKAFRQKQREAKSASTGGCAKSTSTHRNELLVNDIRLSGGNKRGRPKKPKPSIGAAVHDPEAFRRVMVNAYITDFIPIAFWQEPAALATMAAWRHAPTRAMLTATDSIGLLYLGSKQRDPAMILHARQTHIAAIQRLKDELSSSAIVYDSVLGAALSLFLCEIYSVVSSGPQGRDSHISGATTLVKSIKEHTYGTTPSALQKSAHDHFRQACLFHALASRARLPLDASYWQLSGGKPVEGGPEALIRLATRLPDLLADTDYLTGRSEAVSPACSLSELSTYDKLFNLETDLKQWRSAFQLSKIASPESPENQLRKGESIVFRSYYEGTLLQIYWILLLLVQRAKLDLHEFQPYGIPRSALYNSAAACADLLLKSVPDLSDKAGVAIISKVIALSAPLHFAARWYEYSADEQAVSECRKAEARLREEAWYLNWDGILPWSFYMTTWLFGLD